MGLKYEVRISKCETNPKIEISMLKTNTESNRRELRKQR